VLRRCGLGSCDRASLCLRERCVLALARLDNYLTLVLSIDNNLGQSLILLAAFQLLGKFHFVRIVRGCGRGHRAARFLTVDSGLML